MIIGIDLGTTNSLVAYFTEEGPKIIPNRLGKNLTPSVVSVDENGQIFVGETARERMLLYPDTAASVFKRSMGSEKEYKLGEKSFKAEELSSFILRALKEDAESFLGEPVEEAVISVPAYFNDARRKATKRAGEMAGFKVERIISEPTAAAISYGLYQENKNTKFLVFDLGGGTFDVSILELFGNIIEVRAVAGDNFLGGEDFTQKIIELFLQAHPEIDVTSLDEKTLKHIEKQAEQCKIQLDANKSSKMQCTIQGEAVEFELDAQKYEDACEDLFDKIRGPVKRSLSDAHIKVADIDKVVLVGGATKLSMVRKFVSKLFRSIPDTRINPDEAVALGAAIQGAMKERNEAIKEVILTDVCPFTLGTEVVREREENRFEDGHFCPIIERNTVIPASRTERLYTVSDNQSKIRVNILQGESRFAKNNLSLGELLIDIPKNKAGEEAIDVTYTYDINSILEVEVKVISTGEVTKQIIKNQYTELTDEEIKERMEELSYLKIHPRDQEENKLLLLKGERVYEESLGQDRIMVEHAIHRFEMILNTHDNGKIEEARKEFAQFLEEFQE
ncbi:MAG: molecular chaperone HscC [Lachnospiraceae bacterium]|nr:molecular chaperone HscC [Lachnospiraceae bacterium]